MAESKEDRGLKPPALHSADLTPDGANAQPDGPPSILVDVLRKEMKHQAGIREAEQQAERMIDEAEKRVAAKLEALRADLATQEKQYIEQQVAQAREEAQRIVEQATARGETMRATLEAAKGRLVEQGVQIVLEGGSQR